MKFTFALFLLLLIFSCADPNVNIPDQGKDFCADIHRNDSLTLSSQIEDIADSMATKTGVYVLEDGSGSMVARAWLSEYAEKTIDIQYFIFSTDNVGLIACDYIVRAADRGVKVRILVDDITVHTGIDDILTMDAHENIEIKIYNPGVKLGKNIVGQIKKFATDFRNSNQRMHNKTFTVDGKVVITGGRNIANEYFDYDHEYNFRDRDVLLIGKEVKNVSRSFDEFWDSFLSVSATKIVDQLPENLANDNRYERLHQYACNPENFWPQVRERIKNLPSVFQDLKKSGRLVWVEDIQFISDKPGKNDGKSGLGGGGVTTSALIRAVKSAKTSIDIQTPYLITSELGRTLFKEAVDRGIKVRILTNSLASTDNLEAFSGYQRDREKLLDTGIEIYEFRPDAAERIKIMTGELQSALDFKPIFGLHAKTMVVDGQTTVIGTFNMDPRSANLNTECVAIINSKQIADGVLEGMKVEYNPANSWRITKDFNPDDQVAPTKRISTWARRVIPKDVL